jgi:hypothetical protein
MQADMTNNLVPETLGIAHKFSDPLDPLDPLHTLTLQHYNILNFIDSGETPTYVFP